MKYEVIFESGKYALVLRGECMNEYAVVYGLNKERGDWGHTCSYYNFGVYSRMSRVEALSRACDLFRAKTEENYVSYSRLEELATKFKDGLLEDDEEAALEYFDDVCEMTDEEKSWFGIMKVDSFMSTRQEILNHYNEYNGKFEYVENADEYIDKIKTIGNNKVVFVNCTDWFKQYELEQYALKDEISTDHGFYCPYSLLEDAIYYVNEFDDDRYEVYILDNPCCTFLETITGYDEMCKYITDLS